MFHSFSVFFLCFPGLFPFQASSSISRASPDLWHPPRFHSSSAPTADRRRRRHVRRGGSLASRTRRCQRSWDGDGMAMGWRWDGDGMTRDPWISFGDEFSLCIYVCMYGWMEEWMDGWMHGWMDAWKDGWMYG